jgi:peptidoglycan/xylan/chitin deacetylase (PgdA/CDA1 family)
VRPHRPVSMRVPDESRAAAPISTAAAGAIRRVALPPGKKLIALTFDLCETAGETAGYDGSIIDYLRSQRAKATFFAGGRWMFSHVARAQQLLSDPLFEIGTHGWAHRNTRLIGGAELGREILWPVRAYESIRSELSRKQCAGPHAAAFSTIPEQPRLLRQACKPWRMRG